MNSRQVQQQQRTEELSTALITLGTTIVKKNPIKVGLYMLGLLLCIFFQGLKITPGQREEFYQELSKIDSIRLETVETAMYDALYHYNQHRWNFILFEKCSTPDCLYWKSEYYSRKAEFDLVKAEETQKLSNAKAKLGIFSEYGIDETRITFQNSFSLGKRIAKRQSQWDFFFYMISSFGNPNRDENILAYLLKIIVTILFNFTMGMFIAVVNFMIALVGLLRSFQVNLFTGLFFFAMASLAAISYVLTWLIGLYCLTAGGVYVGVKLIAANMRLEDGQGGGRRQNIHYEERYYR